MNIDGFVGGAAVFIQSRYDTIAGNFIGTDLTGTKPGTGNNYGVHITLTSDAVIGGLDTKEGNVISNNTIGVYHDGSDGDRVLNNKIGTDYAGNIAIANNPAGIYAVNSNDIDVGATGSGNVISGNFSQGVNFAGVTNSSIRDNLIGTSSDGFTSIANDVGILIDGKSSDVDIGDNLVSGNVNAGIS